jgi:hypothetical protein|tara:strand:- start:149 stop:562 length:414 start_codon:yes stop_codon:yes gene_type:complete
MTKFCIDVKKTLSKVYYEVKYFYNYYFKSSNNTRPNEYNYTPLREVIIDSQPPVSIPVNYSCPPDFDEPHPNLSYTMNIRKRPSVDFTSTKEKILSPISEKSDSESENDIKITVTESDLPCELDSDDNWEIIEDKTN